MKKLIYTSFSPNTRSEDLVLNLKILFSPLRWLEGSCGGKIIKIFEEKFPDYKAFTFNYARSGMYVLFKSLGLGNTDEALVQGYTCVAAVNPIIWAGGKVTYVDIDSKSGNMNIDDLKKKVSKNTRAILFQYTYGCSQGIEEVKKICEKKSIALIEDCTNTIFGEHGGELIGSFGDASIFSFGRDKAVSGVDGGLILVRKRSKFVSLNSFNQLYHEVKKPERKWVFLELLHPLIWYLIKKFYNLKIGKLIHFISTKVGLLTRATSPNEKMGIRDSNIPSLLPNGLACLALRQLEDIELINKHRKNITDIYEKELKDVPNVKTFLHLPGNVLLRYSIKVENRDDLVKYLEINNVQVGDWYTTPIAPKEVDMGVVGYVEGLCPLGEKVCGQIINLPNHINLSEDGAKRLANLIKKYYGN